MVGQVCVFSLRRVALVLLVALASVAACAQQSKSDQSDAAWKSVESALGRTGKMQPDGTFKFSMPRKDMNVTVAGTQVTAGLALGSWVAFKGTAANTMVMGDLVLAESELEPVMLKLEQGGIEISAIHNHLLNESPRVMYMHVIGHGEATKLAQTLHDALAVTKTPPADSSTPPPQKLDLETAQIDQALGRKGKDNGGIYQFSVPRAEPIRENGMVIPPSMGVATGINFQPTGGGKVAISGDFVLLASEVNPVIRVLRENGIEVTALHSHMLTESPRLFFMHFWANADAIKLAKALHEALQKTNSARQ